MLQDEREKSFNATERLEEHVELKVQQLSVQRERELQEHFYEQTEALQKKVQSLQEALEIMRKNEDIADFDMTSDGITMPLLKTAFMQLQVILCQSKILLIFTRYVLVCDLYDITLAVCIM